MSDHPNIAFGGLLTAICRADGTLDPGEREALRDLLFALPDLDEGQWKAIEREMEAPSDSIEVWAGRVDLSAEGPYARLLDALAERGVLGAREREALARVRADSEPSGALSRLGSALAEALRSRWRALGTQRAREEDWSDSLRRRIRDRWPNGETPPDEARVRALALGAAVLAHVVHLDDRIEAGEVEAMRAAIARHWGVGEAAAAAVAELALEDVAEGIDLHTTLRGFFELTDETERERFLAAVFEVAAGDGRASYDEIEEVRRIGRGLLLSHRHFISAKLRLPEQRRDT